MIRKIVEMETEDSKTKHDVLFRFSVAVYPHDFI